MEYIRIDFTKKAEKWNCNWSAERIYAVYLADKQRCEERPRINMFKKELWQKMESSVWVDTVNRTFHSRKCLRARFASFLSRVPLQNMSMLEANIYHCVIDECDHCAEHLDTDGDDAMGRATEGVIAQWQERIRKGAY